MYVVCKMSQWLKLYCLQYIITILYLTSVKFAKLYNIRQLEWNHIPYENLHIDQILYRFIHPRCILFNDIQNILTAIRALQYLQ